MQVILFTYRSQQNLHFCGGCGSSENYEFWGINLHYKESYRQKILFFFVGATYCMAAVNNNVIYLFVCR